MRRRSVGREPVAYLVGRRGFRQLELEVDARVLVPRPETELLVEVALGAAPRRARGGRRDGQWRRRAGAEGRAARTSGGRDGRQRRRAHRRPRQRVAARTRGGVRGGRPARRRRRRSTRSSPTRPTSPRRTARRWRRRSRATSPRSRSSPAPTGSTSCAAWPSPPGRRPRTSSPWRWARARRRLRRRCCVPRASPARSDIATWPGSSAWWWGAGDGRPGRRRDLQPLHLGGRRRRLPDGHGLRPGLRAGEPRGGRRSSTCSSAAAPTSPPRSCSSRSSWRWPRCPSSARARARR